jgi:hypothetical protein
MEQKPGDLDRGRAATLEDRSRTVLWEVWLFRYTIVLFVAFRVVLAWQQTIDSDEPQHAHVAWAWAHGLVQYRDVFDNHTPLFHLLAAPWVALIGERPDILALLRCGIIGLNLMTLFLVWRICCSLFSAQAGRWTVIVLAFFPSFFLDGGEFRTDTLWTTLWVAWIGLAMSQARFGSKCFWGGLLMAACFSVSLKSVLLLLTAVVAFAVVFGLRSRFEPAPAKVPRVVFFKGPALALAGFAILAGSILCFFIALGAGPAMYRCVIQHNLDGDDVDFARRLLSGSLDPRFWFFVPAVYFVAFQLGKSDKPERRFRIAFLVLFAGFYPCLLLGVWPVTTRQDFLPYYPLLFACLSALVLWFSKRWPQQRKSPQLTSLIGFAVLLCLEAGWSTTVLLRKLGPDPIEAHRIGEVLRLTKPEETVLDPKGEVVLRPRPIYDVLELFTMRRYRNDPLLDRIPEQLIANRTMVAVQSDRYPDRTRRFLQENYLWTGRLLLAGMQAHANARGSIQFHLSLGGSYVFLSNGHLVSGQLNGVFIPAEAEMEPGSFEFVPDKHVRQLTIQWKRAYQIGIIAGSDENLPWHGQTPANL